MITPRSSLMTRRSALLGGAAAMASAFSIGTARAASEVKIGALFPADRRKRQQRRCQCCGT